MDEKNEETVNENDTEKKKKEEIMTALHEYNEIKDAAQIVIGQLANIRNVTVKELHIHYGLDLNE